MQREQFLAQLDALTNEAMVSNDEVVRQSAVVLLGLKASVLAGEDFFDAFVDNVATVIKSQRDIMIEMMRDTR